MLGDDDGRGRVRGSECGGVDELVERGEGAELPCEAVMLRSMSSVCCLLM